MDNNTNNIDTSVFGRLKRLFSNDVIIRNKGGKQLKTIDWNNIQAAGNVKTNSLVDRFTRLHRYGANMAASPTMNYQTLRIQLYNDYEAMEGEPIIASCLDIVADESTLKNEMGEVLQIRSSDENTQRILYNLFYDVLNIEFNLWTWVRNMCKYGDFYLHLEMAEKYGIYKAIPLSVYDITREEGYDEDNMDKVKFTMDPMSLGGGAFSQIYRSNTTKEGKIEFDNYEIAHFRLLSDANYLPYGRSFIEPARKVYKQYSLMKDAMLLHRIMRAPEKRVHYVQVGNLPPNEIDTFMQKLMQRSKKTPYIDQQTGEYNLKFNMQNMIEDYYIPQRGPNDGTRIETLPGLQYNAIEDVQFLRDEMLSALKVPKAFFGFEKDLQGKCISLDTKIPLLDGRTLTAQEIINEYNDGKKNYVYSIDETTNNMVPGEIEWAGLTRMNTQTLKVWLDNGEHIQCTPDHLFLTRDGKWKEAQTLSIGEPLMPLYLQKSTDKKINGYEQVYYPSTGKYEFVHRMVAEHYGLKQTNKVIHHKDCNKLNNNPDNLDSSMSFWEHRRWHIEHAMLCHTDEANLKRKNTHIKLMQNVDYAKMKKEICKNNSVNLIKWIKENGASRKGYRKLLYTNCKGCGDVIDTKSVSSHKINNYCSIECKHKNWKSKYNSISLQNLIENAKDVINFTELRNKLGIKDSSTLSKLFKYHKLDKSQFIIDYMKQAHSNAQFMSQTPETNKYYIDNFNPSRHEFKEKYNYKNHTVQSIEWIEEKIDTCDLTISKYHNFGTAAGVIIHNSTLAAEDIRFARTIERVQRITLSILYKIAYTHLYIQGFDGEALSNFELSLTTPSVVYEQEKVALWKERVSLAKDMLDTNMFPTDLIYDHVFQFSEDQYDEYRDLVLEDKKRLFRLSQVENEGNDPAKTGKSYGTKHDLASLYGKGRMEDNTNTPLPKGYDEKEAENVGRPVVNKSIIGTQQDPMGKDRMGNIQMKPSNDNVDKYNDSNNFRGGSPLALSELTKHERMLKNIPRNKDKKQIIFESNEKPGIFDEKNIRNT